MSLTRLKPTGVNATAQFSMANLAVSGNVSANIVKTDHISHINGTAWDFTTYPAGSTTQIAFNDAGVFGANANLTFDKSTKTLATDNVSAKVLTGNLTTAIQSNITTVGTLTDLAVAGNAVINGNLTVSGTTTTINSTIVEVVDTAIVLAKNATTQVQANGAGFIINGAGANLLYNNASNSFVSSHKITADGSLLSALTGANVTGRVALANIANTVSASSQPAITSVGTLTGLIVSGEIITQFVTATALTGTINEDSNAQPNITSVGTLVDLDVAGNITGAKVTASNIRSTGNIIGDSKLFVGTGTSTLTNPVAVFQGSGATFDQIALFNSVGTGSSDYVAYGDLGTDSQAWTDMGFAGSTFNDANYTVTAPGDGYLFVQGNSSFGGNLVLATGDVGTTHDIILATGGFKLANIKARLYHSNGAFNVVGNISGGNLTTAGNIVATGNADVGNIGATNGVFSTVAGNLTTAAQPNVTSVGTLTNVTVSGNANVANLSANTTVSFTGNTSISAWLSSAQSTEVVNSIGAVAASTINYNMATGATFYHSSITSGANWTANIQNVPTTDGRSIVMTIMAVQGSTPYIPNALQIDGVAQSIKWSSGIVPTGRSGAVDIFSFGLVRAGAAWVQILGSYTSYS